MACTRGLGRPILVVALVFYSPRVMPGVELNRFVASVRNACPVCWQRFGDGEW